MKNTFSSKQLAKSAILSADLIMRQIKLDKTAKFMAIKSNNPKLKQYGLARKPKISSFSLKRNRRELSMLSPYILPPSSEIHTRKQKPSNHTKHNIKMNSNDIKMIQMTSKLPQKTMTNLFLKK